MDSGSIERSLPQHLLDEIVQEEADALLEEHGWCDPQALEARIAHRFASMTDDELAALRERSAARRLQRRIASTAHRLMMRVWPAAEPRMRGR